MVNQYKGTSKEDIIYWYFFHPLHSRIEFKAFVLSQPESFNIYQIYKEHGWAIALYNFIHY